MARMLHKTDNIALGKRPARRRRSLVLVAATASALTALGTFTSGIALASTPIGQAVHIRPPANVEPGSGVFLFGVGCALPSTCSAGGVYIDASNHEQAMVVSGSRGHWGRATKLRLPTSAPANPLAQVLSVACAGPGTCEAGGYYSANGHLKGFVAAQTHGAWSRARVLRPPSNSMAPPDFQVTGVSCTKPGSCVAIGHYEDKTGRNVAFAATESRGTWHRAVELQMPSNAQANPDAFLDSVSCGGQGSCAAGGQYNASGGLEAVAVTESGGKWHRGRQITMPTGAASNPNANLASVACPVAGTCLAVGQYVDHLAAAQSFTVTFFAGAWRRAAKFTHVPSNAAPNPATELKGVACPQAGSCVAVGVYTDMAGGDASLAAFRHGGRWIAGFEVKPPSNALGGGDLSTELTGISCTRMAFCAAAGNYMSTSHRVEAMAASTPSI